MKMSCIETLFDNHTHANGPIKLQDGRDALMGYLWGGIMGVSHIKWFNNRSFFSLLKIQGT